MVQKIEITVLQKYATNIIKILQLIDSYPFFFMRAESLLPCLILFLRDFITFPQALFLSYNDSRK